jgi:hypothetical protein
MMFSLNDRFLEMVASEVRNKRLQEAQSQRLLRQMRSGSQNNTRFYYRFLHGLGQRLENWGNKLQKHTQPAAEASIFSSSKPASYKG